MIAAEAVRPVPPRADARSALPPAGCRRAGPDDMAYGGPERRRLPAGGPSVLGAMLDEVDYPMILVDGEGEVVHANRAARQDLAQPAHPLQLAGRQLLGREPAVADMLRETLSRAARHPQRRVVACGQGDARISIGLVPLGQHPGMAGAGAAAGERQRPGMTMLVLGRRKVCPALTVQWFASAHGLTRCESHVLAQLCAGQSPGEVAEAQGVAISTVRTQVASIRAKTGASSIRDIVSRLAAMPPMVTLLGPA